MTKQRDSVSLAANEPSIPKNQRTSIVLMALLLFVSASPSGLAEWMAGYQFTVGVCVCLTAVALASMERANSKVPPVWLVLFFAYGFATAGTSLDTSSTLYALMTFGAVSCCAVVLARRMTLQSLTVSVVVVGISSLLLSLALLAISPDRALSAGMLNGVFSHKNILGFVLASGFTASLFLKRRFFTPLIITVAASLLYGIWLTDSSTAFLACSISGFTALYIHLRNAFRDRAMLRHFVTLSALCIAGLAVNFLLNQSDKFLAFLGKSPTLSARTQIWDFSLAMWSEQPWLGYGFGAVWSTDSQFRALAQEVLRNPAATHAHSGYIDLILQSGLVGAFVFCAFLLTMLSRSWKASKILPDRSCSFPFAILLFMLFYNLVESRFYNPFAWVIFVAALVMVSTKKSHQEFLPVSARESRQYI